MDIRHIITLVENTNQPFATRLDEAVTSEPLTLYHGTKSEAFDSFAPKNAAKGEQFWNPLGNGMYATDSQFYASSYGSNVHKIIIPAGASYKRITMGVWKTVGTSLVNKALRLAMKQHGQDYDEWRNGGPVTPEPKMSHDDLIKACMSYYTDELGWDDEQAGWKVEDKTDQQLRAFYNRRKPKPTIKRGNDLQTRMLDFDYHLERAMTTEAPADGMCEAAAIVSRYMGNDIADAFHTILPMVADKTFSKYDFTVFTETQEMMGSGKNGASALEVVIFNPAYQKTVSQ